MTWQSLPLLFARGPGGVADSKETKKAAQKKKGSSKPRKRRRKFGDEDDDNDEAWIPKGATTKGKWKRNWRTGVEEYIPPSY